jgi:DNA-binding transcriptional regulator YiaG
MKSVLDTVSTGCKKSLVKEVYDPGKALAELRKRLDISQTKLAGILGYAPRSIANWESGSPMPQHAVRALAELQFIYQRVCILAEEKDVNRWLRTPNKELGGISPYDAMSMGRSAEVWALIILAEEGIPI